MTEPLTPAHRTELETGSGITPAVIAERGYRTVRSPEELAGLGFPGRATSEARFYPGLLVPLYRATGEISAYQWKPAEPAPAGKGERPVKYVSPTGRPSVVDVHPRWQQFIRNPAIPLAITEGAKKADALTSRGWCTVALSGVYNWRSKLGTLGDWEDIPLRGRMVMVVYDSDATTNRQVLQAMSRLGSWLTSKGASAVFYIVTPAELNGAAVEDRKVGVDDFLAAGGTLERLIAVATPRPPEHDTREFFTDAFQAELVAHEVLSDRFIWSLGLGWLRWDGRRWAPCSTEAVTDQVREWMIGRFRAAASQDPTGPTAAGWKAMCSKARLGAVLALAKGVQGIEVADDALDAHPDLLNVANGVVDLSSGTLHPHDPGLLMTKLAPVPYVPGFTHPDWELALTAIPDDVRSWARLRYGQAITGHPPTDDLLVVQQGGGENGKSSITAAVRGALGDYYVLVAHRALLANADAHPTELTELRGARFALLEETPEERRLNVTRLKQLVGTPEITARRIKRDSITWQASHSLFLSTNYKPVVDQTDHGTWRRLALLRFPYRFRKPGEVIETDRDRPADPTLKDRMVLGGDGRYEAALAWLVQGAVEWYQLGRMFPPLPERIRSDTSSWRASNDLVLGYAEDRLEFDHESHVMSSDLLVDINAWLVGRAHRPWSDRTLAERFGEHDSVRFRGVEKRYTKRSDRLSRPPQMGHMPAPKGYQAWLGIRFKTDADPAETPETTPRIPSSSVVGQGTSVNIDSHQVSGVSSEGVNRSSTGPRGVTRSLETPETISNVVEVVDPLQPVMVRRDGSTTVVSFEQVRDGLVETIRAEGALTVDVEHTGYPVGHADHHLKTVQLGGSETAWVLDVRTPGPSRDLVRDFLAVAPRLHAHSGAADLVPLVAAGLAHESAWDRMYDTVIPAKLADPASTGADPDLKQLSAVVLGSAAVSPAAERERAALFKRMKWRTNVDLTTPIERSGWAQADPGDPVMVRYAAADVLDAAAIARKLDWQPAELIDRERRVQRIVSPVSHHGLRLDHQRVLELHAKHTAARDAAGELVKALGVSNPDSDRELATVLTGLSVHLPHTKPSKRFPEGQPSVAAGVLEGLRDVPQQAANLIAAVLEHREHGTLVSTFLEPYRRLCERGDGRARPTIYTLGADTGRMSCVRPNLQNVPQVGGVRACLTADLPWDHLDPVVEWALISADFAGVEVRVGAALSGDAHLRQMIENGEDLHWLVAREVWGPEATKDRKYVAKRINFGWMYGGGIPTLAAQAGVSASIVASVVDMLAVLAPGLVEWSKALRQQVRAGAVAMPTYSGRTIHLPREYPHKAVNYAVQGTARELLVDALIRWDSGPFGGGVVLPIHDEIVAMVPAAVAEEASAELVRCMTSELYGIPIVAEAKEPSFAWQDAV